MNLTDGELLRSYARDHSEAAFEALVQRHIHLIYSAALRQVNGDLQLAEDVTQAVFTALAQKATQLTGHTSLTGWLYTTTRFLAANVRRTEQRRSHREQEARTMNSIFNTTESEPGWVQMRPLLDEAMHTLDAEDRQAVLMRHFENRSYADIGAALGVTDNAARMRVDRALAKLHGTLTKQGVTSTAIALAGLLAANAVGAAPAHLIPKVLKAALTGAVTAGGASVLLSSIFAASKTKLALGTVVAALTAALLFTVASRHASAVGSKTPVAVADAIPATGNVPRAEASATHISDLVSVPVPPKTTNGTVLHLEIITADTGQPIPMVPIDYRGWTGGNFKGRKLMSDRFGICDVIYPTNITELELTTRKDDFADTQLLWRPPNGEIIPTNYVLRIDRPVPIGGVVEDADGRPVAGAKVGWNREDDPTAVKLPQSHDFVWVETTTDQDGRWQINRIAADMIPRLYGSARDTNFVDSGLMFASHDKSVEKQLRDGTFVFKLGRALMVKGVVTDADGVPVPGATILVGYYTMDGSRRGKSQNDGTFAVLGCKPGKQLVTAQATGFALTSVEVDLTNNAEPVHIILKPGKTLRLQVVDNAGNPIPKAYIWYNNFNQGMVAPDQSEPVQVEFNPRTDQDGRAALTNAPAAEMKFDVQADGFQRMNGVKIRPDGAEHVITLSQSPAVHGIVWDEATGLRVPKFRIALGWPERNPPDGTTNDHWSTIGRFWLDFTGGTYHHTFEEPMISGMANPGYVLKFLADGYAPSISRVIGPDESDVQLNVTLRRAVTITVTVYDPAGQPAAAADIGLVFPGANLKLGQGGFSRQNLQTGGALLRTDVNGTFELQPDDSVTRVIAASSAGYAEATPAALSANPVLQLQPWGRLAVTCFSGGNPVAGRLYGLDFGDGSSDAIEFDMSTSHFTTDAQGEFTADDLPPGQRSLVRLYPFSMGPHSGGWRNGDKTPFEIRPGETATLVLGTNDYTVTAQLQWPVGVQREAQWRIDASLHTIMPVMPPEVVTNEAARTAFIQTDAFKAAQQNARNYPATLNPDGTLAMDGVKPGDYALSVFVTSTGGNNSFPGIAGMGNGSRPIALGNANVAVPAGPPAGTLDAGVVELKKVPNVP